MMYRHALSFAAIAAFSLAACGDDGPSNHPDAGGNPDASVPADAAPVRAPRLRNELDDLSDEEVAVSAVWLLGAPIKGARESCNSCHGITAERLRSWAPAGAGASPACLDDLEIATPESAKKMMACLRLEPGTPGSPFVTSRLGIYAAAAGLPWFEVLFARAEGDAGPSAWQTFQRAVLMPKPKSGHPPFTQHEFDIVAEWYQRGLPLIDELLSKSPPPPATCEESISPVVAEHVRAMATDGWRARNARSGMLMHGCARDGQPIECLSEYPRASSTTFGATWVVLPGAVLRVLRSNDYASYFWTRSSPDGRFVAHGGSSSELGASIVDLQRDRVILAAATYDPGFFPDNSAFVFQGTADGTAVCDNALLRAAPERVSFEEPQCSHGASLALYQHVGAGLDGDDYWAVTSDFMSDDGGRGKDIHDPATYFPADDLITLTPMVHQGNGFEAGTPVDIASPFEGDTVISPSARLLVSRVAGPGGHQKGLRLRQVKTVREGDELRAEIPEVARFCALNGGKPAFSYDERWIVMHHYVENEDAMDLGFTGPSDPGFAAYRQQGAANLYLVDLLTGQRTRITHMSPGQFALFPHFRSDGWIYFMVREQDQTTEHVVASDAAIVLAR
jgi:predicted small lipoprotein YifL